LGRPLEFLHSPLSPLRERSCERINNLIPQSGTKTQRLAKNNCFVFCAPLREMLLLIHGLFHSFRAGQR
jgi:hypothetical protein